MQTFRVLRCVECSLFQVDIVKKAKKWSCRVCSHKQNVIKIYFESGAATECREAVQRLNSVVQQRNESFENNVIEQLEQAEVLSVNCARDNSVVVESTEVDTKKEDTDGWVRLPKLNKGSENLEDSGERMTVHNLFISRKRTFRTTENDSESSFEGTNNDHFSLKSSQSKFFNHHNAFSPHSEAPNTSPSPDPQSTKSKVSSKDEFSASQSDRDFWNNLF